MLPEIHLRPGREKSIYNRHPWIFSGAVKKAPNIPTGTIVKVYTADNRIVGYGFFDAESQISCKIFHFSSDHQEASFFNEQFWFRKIEEAVSFRKKYILNESTDSCRLVHAEGDMLPGLIADLYAGTVVLQILHKGTENILNYISDSFFQLGFKHVYIKTKESSKHIEYISISSGWMGQAAPQPLTIKEHGNQFLVNVETGQKTGFFLDQRENRKLVGSLSRGKTVLNAFSYSGGFSVYAGAGGAKKVVSVDISKDAIETCRQNMDLNGHEAIHEALALDCFDYLKQMPEDYFDLIVLDPPAFAKSAKMVSNASRGYKEINLSAFRKIKSGGLLFTYSCSKNIDRDLFRKIVFGAAADSGRIVQIINQLTQPSDHPVNIYHPEGEYLKGLVLRVI